MASNQRPDHLKGGCPTVSDQMKAGSFWQYSLQGVPHWWILQLYYDVEGKGRDISNE
jgi:hypothetical protein